MSFLKLNCIFVLLLITTLCAQAQERTISGKVVSAKTGEPLSHVTISVPALSQTVTSNDAGIFTLTLPAQKTDITISATGYATTQLTIAASQTNIVVQLTEDAKNLDEIVVTGYSEGLTF